MFSPERWEALWDNFYLVWEGLGNTLLASFFALVLALTLGILFGILSSSQWKIARGITRAYVEFFQNTPLLLQVIFLAFGLPLIWPAFVIIPLLGVGAIGLGIYHGAYISEAVRAGIQSIPKGQLEASLSQGMTFWQAMGHVVIPQALTVVLPPLTNQAVSLIKNSSVLLFIGAFDMMYQARLISATFHNPGPTFVVIMLMYFAICFPLAVLAKRLEDRLSDAKAGA